MDPRMAPHLARLAPGEAAHLELPDRLDGNRPRRTLVLREQSARIDRLGELVPVDAWRIGLWLGDARAPIGVVMLDAAERKWEVLFNYHATGEDPGAALAALAAQERAHVVLVGDDGRVARDGLRYQAGGAKLRRFANTLLVELRRRPAWRVGDYDDSRRAMEAKFPSRDARWEALGKDAVEGWLPQTAWRPV